MHVQYHIKTDITETRQEDVDWIHLAQNRNQQCALVNKIMKHGVPLDAENSWLRYRCWATQEWFCFTEVGLRNVEDFTTTEYTPCFSKHSQRQFKIHELFIPALNPLRTSKSQYTCTYIRVHDELPALRPTSKLENPQSDIRDCLVKVLRYSPHLEADHASPS
jgi:hypothetical protein